ncbi:hypothetical protein B0A49_01849 [Cryomyces minteri]|uniref:Uncharacterized protein n=1 Tax=Cryomyces minteri TaxID=331657 RepID=A0A4U0XMT9_9PEZI|nr:hypothetical protein B0A49_01849 [Cryomyces minteri]
MASYDYRSYPSDTQSRRHESRHRLRDDNPTSSSSSKHTYSYDPRYSYPPPRSRSPPQAFRSSRGARRRWPPAPIAEDEASSLAREFRPVKALDDEKSSEASCRGTIDQEPIIVEIDNNERRFVLVEDGRPSALPTPPSSDAEKDRRGRQKAPRIETDFNDVPVFTRRAPSPYAYTKPGNLNTGRSSGEFFLSPDVMTPPSASRARSAARSERSHKSSSRYSPTGPTHPSARPVKNEALRTPTTSDSGNDVSDDSELEPVNAASFRRKREPAQYSFTNTSLPKADRGTSVHDFVKKSDPCGGASSSRSQDDKIQNSKRNIDVASSSVPRRYEYSKQKPTPLKPTVFTQDDIYSRPSAGLSPSVGPLPGYNTGRAHSAAPVAPLSSAAASYYLPSPPGSPRNPTLKLLHIPRPRLDLIQALASISATEQECPGRKKDIRAWYGIPDGNGGHLRNFHICPCDVRRIEALLPSLRGLFTRVYRSDPSRKRPCDFRTESQRFPAYLDLLIDADERATRERRAADLTPFAKFARRKASTRECAHDTVLFDEVWHYIPRCPNSPRTAQMVHDDGLGSSCQLYSPRMRKVFLKAVEDDDLIYLKRKARDRKYTEIALQAENGKIQKLAKGKVRVHDAPYAGWQDGETLDVGRLEKKLERLAEQWKAWE